MYSVWTECPFLRSRNGKIIRNTAWDGAPPQRLSSRTIAGCPVSVANLARQFEGRVWKRACQARLQNCLLTSRDESWEFFCRAGNEGGLRGVPSIALVVSHLGTSGERQWPGVQCKQTAPGFTRDTPPRTSRFRARSGQEAGVPQRIEGRVKSHRVVEKMRCMASERVRW